MCLYSGLINGFRVILMRQVDNFAIATKDECTANMLMDLIDNNLSIPLKRQGLIDMFNGINITQTRDYIKIDCHMYIGRFCKQYINTWLGNITTTENKPIPLPACPVWQKKFNSAIGSTNPKDRLALAKSMQLNYRAGVGKLIWAMTTCQPDIAFASIKLSQLNSCPHEHHYHGLKHTMKYLYATCNDGIYYWRSQANHSLHQQPIPPINSNKADFLLDKRKHHALNVAVTYADYDWAT